MLGVVEFHVFQRQLQERVGKSPAAGFVSISLILLAAALVHKTCMSPCFTGECCPILSGEAGKIFAAKKQQQQTDATASSCFQPHLMVLQVCLTDSSKA